MCEGVATRLKAKALVWKRNCGTSVAVYFWCGNGAMELPSFIPCAEAEYQSHNILCAEAELQNLKSQYIPSVEAELWLRAT